MFPPNPPALFPREMGLDKHDSCGAGRGSGRRRWSRRAMARGSETQFDCRPRAICCLKAALIAKTAGLLAKLGFFLHGK